MATVGSLIINLAMNTTGLASGISQAEAQLAGLQAHITGVGVVAGNSATMLAKLGMAQDAVAAASRREAMAAEAVIAANNARVIAALRLTELQAKANVQASTMAAASERYRLSVVAVTHATEAQVAATAQLAKAKSALASAQAASTATTSMNPAKDFSMIGAAATLASFAILKFGYDSAKVAADFEYEMLMIQTQAGMSAAQVREISAAVLEMAPTVQHAPTELAKGIFHIASVGYDAAKSMQILETAAKGAAIGNADLETVTNALVAVVVSGISDIQGMSNGITDMGRAMGVLNGIVGAGNMRMQDLAASMSSGVLSTAKQFGISIQQLGAAMAAMTDQGIPAEETATRLRITIAMMGSPVRIAERELAKVGLTQRSLADEMRGPRGLIGALRMLQEHMDGAGLDAVQQSQMLKTAFGGSRSSSGILTLINSLDLLDLKIGMVTRKGEQFDEDFANESQTATAHFRNFGAAVEVLQIKMGNTLLPALVVLVTVLGAVADHAEIVTALFLVFTAAITGMAVKAVVGFIVSIGQMIATTVTWLLTMYSVSGAFSGIAVSSGTAASGIGAAGAAAAAAAPLFGGAAAAANAAALANAGLASAGAAAAASTGPVVAGFASASGAMSGAAASTGPVIAGFSGAAGAMAATAASTGPLVAGIAGAGGAMAATAATSGALVAGIAGAGGAIAATAASTGPLVVGVQTAAGAQEALAATTAPVIVGLNGQAAAMGGVASAAGTMAAATTAAGGGAAVLGAAAPVAATGVAGLTLAIGALMLPITLLMVAFGLLLLNFDRVVQGLRVLAVSFLNSFIVISDAASHMPGIGEVYKKVAVDLRAARDKILTEMGTAEAAINEKAAASGIEGIQGMIDAAKRQAEGEFRDLNMTLLDLWGTSLAGAQNAAQEAGAADMAAYAKGILDAQDAPVQALKALQERLANQMSESQEIARLVGQLNGQEMLQGLMSQDPATYAAAEAMRKTVIERLDQITGNAYTAGTDAAASWQDAFRADFLKGGGNEADLQSAFDRMTPDMIKRYETQWKALGASWRAIAPDARTAAAAYQALLASLESSSSTMSQVASQAKAAMTSAFNEIKAKAMEYFDAVHDKNMQAISDARDHKNALLDAKAALNQAPVTAAQKALDFQRQAIQEWRLRQAISKATTPEAQRDAVMALQDFLAQRHVDMMQDEVDAAEESIDKQKKANDDAYQAQVKAENKRYEQQKKSFSRELEALERHLRTHPGEWAKANAKIIALLNSYGVDYHNAGNLLGSEFANAMKEQLSIVEQAVKDLQASIKETLQDSTEIVPPWGTGLPPGFHPPIGGFAVGAWDLPNDQTARVHAREMILRPDIAGAIRGMVGPGRGMSALPRLVGLGLQKERAAGAVVMPFAPGGGSGEMRVGSADVGSSRSRGSSMGVDTLVVQIGQEKLAEIVDSSLHSSTSVYGRRGSVRVKSRR